MNTKHSQLPWHILDLGRILSIETDAPSQVCEINVEGCQPFMRQEAEADARLIVNACNSHAATVEALRVADTWAERVINQHGQCERQVRGCTHERDLLEARAYQELRKEKP